MTGAGPGSPPVQPRVRGESGGCQGDPSGALEPPARGRTSAVRRRRHGQTKRGELYQRAPHQRTSHIDTNHTDGGSSAPAPAWGLSELRKTALRLYAQTKPLSSTSPPPKRPRKPTRISSKVKILLMRKGEGKKERLREVGKDVRRLGKAWPWFLRGEQDSPAGSAPGWCPGAAAAAAVFRAAVILLEAPFPLPPSPLHLLTPLQRQNSPFALKPEHKPCFLSLAKVVLIRRRP